MSSYETALAADPEVAHLIGEELNRQQTTLQLIASENFTSPAVLAASGSVLTNKYSEGYPGRRYYGGNQIIDEVEDLARDRATALFGADHANVQPHAGANANLAVYQALLEPGATILAMRLDHGGHLTPRLAGVHRVQVLALRLLRRHPAVLGRVEPRRGHRLRPGRPPRQDREAGADRRGIDGLRPGHRPPALPRDRGLGGRALHVRRRPPGRPDRRRCPPEPGRRRRRRHADHAQDAAGPAGRRHPLRRDLAKKIDSAVFPGLQGGPLEHVIAAKAVAFAEAARPEFRRYAAQVVPTRPRWPKRWPGTGSGSSRAAPTTTWCSSTCALRRRADRQGGPGGPRPGRYHLQPQHDSRRPALPVPHFGPAPGTAARRRPAWGRARWRSWPISSSARSRPGQTKGRSARCARRSPNCAPPSRRIPISWPSRARHRLVRPGPGGCGGRHGRADGPGQAHRPAGGLRRPPGRAHGAHEADPVRRRRRHVHGFHGRRPGARPPCRSCARSSRTRPR